ncbi:alpha/beta fold hydrolase [Rhizobium halophytocola]
MSVQQRNLPFPGGVLTAEVTSMTLSVPPAEWLSQHPGRNFVLLHGLVMAPTFWRLYAPRYVVEHNTVAYPLPGHDRWHLPVTGQVITTEDIIEAYAAAIERDFDGHPVTLVGHSTGAFISLLLAERRPDLVRSVVLMGGFACGRFEGQERFAARLLRIPGIGMSVFCTLLKRWISTPEGFRQGSSDCVFDKSCPWETAETVAMIEAVRQRLLTCKPQDIAAVVSWFQRTSLLDRIANVEVPVLNLIGINDEVVPPLHQLRLSRLLPNVQTVLFGKSGHLLMVERQGELDRVFARFCADPWLLQPSRRPLPAGPKNEMVLPRQNSFLSQVLPSFVSRGTNAPRAH